MGHSEHAAETFGRLIPQNPLEGIDDVALAASVGADDARHPFGEVEHSSISEALEAEQFEGLEHLGFV